MEEKSRVLKCVMRDGDNLRSDLCYVIWTSGSSVDCGPRGTYPKLDLETDQFVEKSHLDV